MAYDEALAQRVRTLLAHQEELRERKMFGGLAFMLRGNMCCGIVGDELMVRVGPERYGAALAQPHARMLDFTGRPMTGMVMVAADGVAADEGLAGWVGQGVTFAASLPAK
jgi:TfoX/Sxy family transcriptional regulator of competence genes